MLRVLPPGKLVRRGPEWELLRRHSVPRAIRAKWQRIDAEAVELFLCGGRDTALEIGGQLRSVVEAERWATYLCGNDQRPKSPEHSQVFCKPFWRSCHTDTLQVSYDVIQCPHIARLQRHCSGEALQMCGLADLLVVHERDEPCKCSGTPVGAFIASETQLNLDPRTDQVELESADVLQDELHRMIARRYRFINLTHGWVAVDSFVEQDVVVVGSSNTSQANELIGLVHSARHSSRTVQSIR